MRWVSLSLTGESLYKLKRNSLNSFISFLIDYIRNDDVITRRSNKNGKIPDLVTC